MTPKGILSVNVLKRGWDVPGGHLEAGEDSLMAVVREIEEEAGLKLDPSELSLYGWTHLEVLAPMPENYPYPYPHTYQPVFIARVSEDRVHDLETQVPEEVGEVKVIPYADAPALIARATWTPLLEDLARKQ